MHIETARARIHAMISDPDGTTTPELDRRIDQLIAVVRQTATTEEERPEAVPGTDY